jgi:hypothetical protein
VFALGRREPFSNRMILRTGFRRAIWSREIDPFNEASPSKAKNYAVLSLPVLAATRQSPLL